MNRGMVIAVVCLLATASAAHHEPYDKVTGRDFKQWSKLRDQVLFAEEWKALVPAADEARRAAIDADRDKAFADAGWTLEKYEGAKKALADIAEALDSLDKGGDEANDAKLALRDFDPVTIKTVEKNREAISDERPKLRARERARLAEQKARAGRPPTAQELQGTWEVDYVATVENMTSSLTEEQRRELVRKLEEGTGKSTFVFRGNTVEAKLERPGGRDDVSTGTFAVKGNTLYLKGGRKAGARKMTVGLRSADELLLSINGTGTVYKRK